MTEVIYKTYRCEWQVVIQSVDQYGRIDGHAKVLTCWRNREEAYMDLPNHGRKHKYVNGRWVPNDAISEYVLLEVRYEEVLQ
jgi:hypothetical protein